MPTTSPTQRTLHTLRAEGWLPQVVERWLPYARVRQDFLGFADVLAVLVGQPVLAVQTTSASNHAARATKAAALPALRVWLEAGCRFEVWSWGKRQGRWCCRRQALGMDDLTTGPAEPLTQEN